MSALDARLHAARPDLADATLRGQVDAARFVAGEPARVAAAAATLRPAPDPTVSIDTELLHGEPLTCFERKDGWAWVQSGWDRYVGYVREDALSFDAPEPSHVVTALRTFRYTAPNLKAPVVDALSLGSAVAAGAREDRFVAVAGGWIFGEHLVRADAVERDPVATARRFLGTPYRWGGRTSVGLDCSALVQLALLRAGIPCLRDTDLQATTVGEPVPFDTGDPRPHRGDLLYMPRHVAIALDGERVLHATAHTMLVCVEPLADLLSRVRAETGGGLTGVRRPAAPGQSS